MQQAILELKDNLFPILSSSPALGDVARGRKGGILVDIKHAGDVIPIVRSTTGYSIPPVPFSEDHYELIKQIQNQYQELKLEFNNAMIETYTQEYYRMGFHTDQALDLADDSYICLFSCYSHPETKDIRKLQVQNKTTGKEIELNLHHNSIILFSTQTNREHVHKIILDLEERDEKTIWLGLTLRLSKTFVKFVEKIPYFLSPDGPEDSKDTKDTKDVLHLANKEERKEFIHLKSRENKEIDFVYPHLSYTLSAGDLLPIAAAH